MLAIHSTFAIARCAASGRGGPTFSLEGKPTVTFEDDETLTWYSSSEWAERGFCRECGSSLFYRLKHAEGELTVSAGSLDDVDGLHVESQIFIDGKPAYYTFAGDIPSMTGDEVFALYSGDGGNGDAS